MKLTPHTPHIDSALTEKVIEESAVLYGAIAKSPETYRSVCDLVRRLNSYYSNIIEGVDTSPYHVDEMMRKASADRSPQDESIANILAWAQLESDIATGVIENIDSDLIKWIHQAFYDHMPEASHHVKGEKGSMPVIPGAYRNFDVKVYNHVAPPSGELPALMKEFERNYQFTGEDKLKVQRLNKIAAAHHRFMFIHPFADGNGRTGRLLTDAMMMLSGIKGYGLWSVSRGFAKSNEGYRDKLADADSPRMGDLDGRGQLSQKGLNRFCEYFLETALDQIHYMSSLFELSHIKKRFEIYVNVVRSTEAMIPGKKLAPLRPGTEKVLYDLFVNGKLGRGEIGDIMGLSPRLTSSYIKQGVEDGVFVPTGDSHRSEIKLGFTPHLVTNIFPNLYPEKYLTSHLNDEFDLHDKIEGVRSKKLKPGGP